MPVALANLVRFCLMPGQRSDSVDVPPLIDGIALGGLIADKASSWVPGLCLRHAPE